MVSSTLCPDVHILGSQNVYSRAEGIADHYWPWADFLGTIRYMKSYFHNSKIVSAMTLPIELFYPFADICAKSAT